MKKNAPALSAQDALSHNSNAADFAGIIESAMDAIITVDERHVVIYFNKAAERMFKCSKAHAIGKPLDNFMPQRYREAHSHHVEKFGKSQVTDRAMGHQRPLTALRADGEEFPIEASISQVEVQGHKRFTAIVRDITQRVRDQRLLAEMEARYRTVFEHAAFGILMIDPAGVVIDANPTCEKLFACNKDQLCHRPYTSLVHPRDARSAQVYSLLKDPKKQSSIELEVRLLAVDKRPLWARIVYTVVTGVQGTPLYFLAIIEDITARKRAQRHLLRLRAKHEGTLNHFARLTDREREVMWLMIDGKATKVIASDLGASPKTIDVHRGRVMEKMEASSLPQLVQMIMPIRKHIHQLST
jgi:PAS domain S-box-containing protein